MIRIQLTAVNGVGELHELILPYEGKEKNSTWVRNFSNILDFPHYTVSKFYLLVPYLEFAKGNNYSLFVDKNASFTSYIYNSGKNSNVVLRK